MHPEDIIRVDRIIFKFLWNKKWDGKCPDRIQRQVLKNTYEMGGLKAPDMRALNSALKVKSLSMPLNQTIRLTGDPPFYS